MDGRVFPVRSYVTLTWQLAAFSLAVTLVLRRYVFSRLVWLLPVCVLLLSIPYIVRIVELIGDMRRGARREARLTLRDISEEYAVAIHHQRGMVHWTLMFEEAERPGQLTVLSVAARRQDLRALFELGAEYQVTWLPASRIIRRAARAA